MLRNSVKVTTPIHGIFELQYAPKKIPYIVAHHFFRHACIESTHLVPPAHASGYPQRRNHKAH